MKNFLNFFLPSTFLLAVLAGGCYYDNNAELHPESEINSGTCDTTATISFAADVVPILNQSCGTKNSCHSSTNTSNYPLNNYAGVKAVADNGLLVGDITVDPNDGTSIMPKNSSPLNDCFIAKITKWVAAGAPNN